MLYPEMILPFEMIPFAEMKKKQAEQYLQWYVDTIDIRINNLEMYIKENKGDFCLDKTPESLIKLWEWFEPHIVLCKKTEEEIQAEILNYPKWMHDIIRQNTSKISLNTLIIAYDISAYLGEVIIKNHPQIKWGYLSKPKRLHGVNRPRLLGFEAGLSVYTYGRVEVCIRKSIKSPDKMYLYNAYEICVNMI